MITDKVYKLTAIYTLKQPMSHIGESESTTTFLNTVRVLCGGEPTEVFAYSGNAIRGALRDAGARYMLDKLQTAVPRKTFHLLFSGGAISGDQKCDIVQARQMRETIPFLSVFGGGVGNQILSGKIQQTFAFPICQETANIVPGGIAGVDYAAQATSWRRMTGEIQFSRRDDGKDEAGHRYMLSDAATPLLEGKGAKKAKAEAVPTQIRYAVEYLVAGAQLWHETRLTCTELEMGAYVSALHEWAKNPVLGGMTGKGFGMVDMRMTLADGSVFFAVEDAVPQLSEPAREAKERYDSHLKRLYDAALTEKREGIVAMLEGNG